MIVDAHVHVGKMEALGLEATGEFAVDMCAKAGIDAIVCISQIALHYDMEEGNRSLYELTRRFAGKVYGYATICSHRLGQEALREMEKCITRYGFCGVKIYSTDRVSIDDYWGAEILRLAADLGVPVLAHSNPHECEWLAGKVPGGALIMAHMGNTLHAKGDWQRAIMAAEACPNIYLDISGSPIQWGFIEEAVERVGPERLIFGSDLPLFDPRVQLAKVKDAAITEDVRTKILGGNIMRLAKLGGTTDAPK